MALKGKVVRDGNSWSVRLPKAVLELSGIDPAADGEVELQVRGERIIIRPVARTAGQRLARDDGYEQARLDMKRAWDEAFEEIWLEMVGTEE